MKVKTYSSEQKESVDQVISYLNVIVIFAIESVPHILLQVHSIRLKFDIEVYHIYCFKFTQSD